MLIAIDYDGTYTADPKLWQMFIEKAIASGHQVICATMRYECEVDSMCSILKSLVQVVPTKRAAKLPFLKAKGIEPDIWIDDNPLWIYNDSM